MAPHGGGHAPARWQAELRYGLPALGGCFAAGPHLQLGLDGQARELALGWWLTPDRADAPDVSLGLKASRQEQDTATPTHAAGLEVRARW